MAQTNAKRLILVTGATGKQGGAAVRHLRDRGFPVRALTRHPDSPAARKLATEGVSVVSGDFADFESLRRAMEDVYGVFAVSTPFEAGMDAEVAQGNALADAAQRARVEHFVYTSVGAADRKTGIPHFETKFQVEQHVRGKGFPHLTILRPVFFMENWLGMKDMITQGTIYSALSPGTSLQQIAVSDIGAFAALAFEHRDHWNGKAVELAGDELTMTHQAEVFARRTGHDVAYQQIPWDAFEQKMGHEMTVMFRWFEEHGYSADIEALRRDYSGLTSFNTWVKEHEF